MLDSRQARAHLQVRTRVTSLFPDTGPEAEAVLIGLLRQAPPWRKLRMVGKLNQTVRTLALSGLRQRHPDATPQELRRRLADLLLGPDLAAQHSARSKNRGCPMLPEQAVRSQSGNGDTCWEG